MAYRATKSFRRCSNYFDARLPVFQPNRRYRGMNSWRPGVQQFMQREKEVSRELWESLYRWYRGNSLSCPSPLFHFFDAIQVSKETRAMRGNEHSQGLPWGSLSHYSRKRCSYPVEPRRSINVKLYLSLYFS